MAIKRKDKNKKKAKKGKFRGKDDWLFDGINPVSYSEEKNKQKKKKKNDNNSNNQYNEHNESLNNKEKRGPRRTQERDERLRRSKLKHQQKRLKNQFILKMKHKLKFSDILNQNNNNSDNDDNRDSSKTRVSDSDSDEIENNVKPAKVNVPNRTNPISIANRLVMLMNRRKKNRMKNSEDSKIEDQGDNDEDIGDNNSDDEDNEEDEEEDEEEDDENKDNEDDMDDGSVIDTKGDSSISELYHNFFSSDHVNNTNQNHSKAMKWISNISNELSIFGTTSTPSISHTISHLRDIPNLHKLWKSRGSMKLSSWDSSILPYISSYSDALIEGRTMNNDSMLLRSLLLHACIHTAKARSIVLKHNQRLRKKLMETKIATASTNNDGGVENNMKSNHQKLKSPLIDIPISNPPKLVTTLSDELDDMDMTNGMQDQGYCRPRTLILCPFRSVALKCIQIIKDILGPNTTIANYDKFLEEYSYVSDMDDNSLANKQQQQKRKEQLNRLPKDWKDTFHEQNTDDDFKLGIQINLGQGKGSGADKGVYIRLYSDFMISDIIIASPLGLRLIIENQNTHHHKDNNHDNNIPFNNNNSNSSNSSNGGYDFLSSLEVVIIHQADIIYMQNWDHIQFLFQYINKLPKLSYDHIDFSRIRKYFLEENQSQYHRQLIITSFFVEPEIQSFFRQYATSKHSYIRVKKNWDCVQSIDHDNSSNNSNSNTVIQEESMQLPLLQINTIIDQQIFHRINRMGKDFSDIETVDDERFKYFCTKILKPILRSEQSGVLIITPKYFDYVRVRNELIRQEIDDVAFICEYSRESEISRGRSRFFHGQKKILVYSGRAHFFRRFQLRGVRHIIFYSLPEYPHFYSEIINFLALSTSHQDQDQHHYTIDSSVNIGSKVSSVTLFSTYEQMALERVVGKKRCQHMLSSEKDTFMFK